MSNVAIRVENLGKLYRLGEIGTGTISHDLNRWWARVRGKEDPFTKIGETNDRTKQSANEYVWALRDITFDINKGEIVGIVGRNGAGKSTLLKILSKVTTPTTGNIKVKGRIASLLEVGTGFHPELTGRENIFLNGAILGMTKSEIRSRFDEIVAFAGVERYVDTPVKRYSSGMYVRLAFSVAAFLQSEILIVDEVLAVGDMEFQQKCIGRMKDISREGGKTVLFVSHNLGAINKLCNEGVLLVNGEVEMLGHISSVTDRYLNSGSNNTAIERFSDGYDNRKGSGQCKFEYIKLLGSFNELRSDFFIGDTLTFEIGIKCEEVVGSSAIAVQIKTMEEFPIYQIINQDSGFKLFLDPGSSCYRITIDNLSLFPGEYKVTLSLSDSKGYDVYDHIENCIHITVLDGGPKVTRSLPRHAGLIFMTPTWKKM